MAKKEVVDNKPFKKTNKDLATKLDGLGSSNNGEVTNKKVKSLH